VITGLRCSAPVKAALVKALEWDREKRFDSMAAFCAALELG
jgi:hypothetical protein